MPSGSKSNRHRTSPPPLLFHLNPPRPDSRNERIHIVHNTERTPLEFGKDDQTNTRFYSPDAMFDVGEDTGSPVSEEYQLPFRSTLLKELPFIP
jgi:hypothetical protein